MARVSETIDIRAPRQRVFEVITDPRRTMEWNPNIVDLRDLKGYPVAIGSSWVQTTVIAGRRVDLKCTIARWKPPDLGVLQITGGQEATVTTECHEVGEVCRVVQTIDFKPPGGFLGSMASGLIGQQVARELRGALQRQKAALEQEAGS